MKILKMESQGEWITKGQFLLAIIEMSIPNLKVGLVFNQN